LGVGEKLVEDQAAMKPEKELTNIAKSLREVSKNELAAQVEQLAVKLENASAALEVAEGMTHAALLAKRREAKKKKEPDPNECKYWYDMESMYKKSEAG